MAIEHILIDENSGFVVATPVVVPISWRYMTTYTEALVGDITYQSVNNTNFTPVGTTITYTPIAPNWTVGGSATFGRRACIYQNGSGYFFRRSFGVYARTGGTTPYVGVSTSTARTFTDTNVLVDFSTTFTDLRAAFSPDSFRIGAVRFCDASGNVEGGSDLIKSGLVSLKMLNSQYVFPNSEAAPLFNVDTTFQQDKVAGGSEAWSFSTDLFPLSDWTSPGVTDNQAGRDYEELTKSLALNTCVANNRTLPMYMKIWVTHIIGGGGSGSSPDDAKLKDADSEGDPGGWESLGGTSGSSGIGSTVEGMNTFYSNYGNSNIPFDSIFLSGSNFNSFVSAGGGIITESGIFAQTASLYIERVRSDIEGSSATIVEAVKFDETPSLTVGEKLYIYLFDNNNQEMPVFCGYITSMKRSLGSSGQEIVYECNDLIHFLDQFYTPSHYIYRPPSYGGYGVTKTYDRVLKEILNVAGIPDAVISIPYFKAPPMTWIYQPLKAVLEWAIKFFGNYVYYIDRSGRLKLSGIDSGSVVKSYAVPSEGTPITDSHVVSGFEPITDFSRSRSRIVLTGDFAITEKRLKGFFNVGGQLHPENNEQTGIFWFYDTIDNDYYDEASGEQHKFYYFMFKPGETLNDKLLTDSSTSCRVTIINYEDDSGNKENKVISPKVFKSESGDSEIYVEGDEFKQSRRIEVIYAVRTDSPIQVSVNTGYFGGTEVVRRPEFKKATSLKGAIDDTALMQAYVNKLKDFYKPIYGGTLHIDGLDLDIQLLDKVSVTGTTLPATEASSLAIYGIEWDVVNKKTTISLSNKTYLDLPFFDTTRERTRDTNELLAKMGLLEEQELYYRS